MDTTTNDMDAADVPAPVAPGSSAPAVRLRGASLGYGSHLLWDGLNLDVAPGEFVAVLGPNGAGKTSLLRVLLGLQQLTSGSVQISGQRARRGSAAIGYVPQQKSFDPGLPVRARDLVGLGIDGHRWGLVLPSRRRRARVDAALDSVGALPYADVPVGLLSGGEQQRLRIAQALITDPAVLLCDEPLLSLDLAHQKGVSELIDQRRHTAGSAVLFVTHDINPVLTMVDRVLYLVDGAFRIGTPDEVLTGSVLSQMYGVPIEVLRAGDRIIVLGAEHHTHHGHHDDVRSIP